MKYLDGIRNRKPSHWCAPETVILIRALHKLGVRRKRIMEMTGISDSGITSYVTRYEKHRVRQTIRKPHPQDLREAAERLAEFVVNNIDPRSSSSELPREQTHSITEEEVNGRT